MRRFCFRPLLRRLCLFFALFLLLLCTGCKPPSSYSIQNADRLKEIGIFSKRYVQKISEGYLIADIENLPYGMESRREEPIGRILLADENLQERLLVWQGGVPLDFVCKGDKLLVRSANKNASYALTLSRLSTGEVLDVMELLPGTDVPSLSYFEKHDLPDTLEELFSLPVFAPDSFLKLLAESQNFDRILSEPFAGNIQFYSTHTLLNEKSFGFAAFNQTGDLRAFQWVDRVSDTELYNEGEGLLSYPYAFSEGETLYFYPNTYRYADGYYDYLPLHLRRYSPEKKLMDALSFDSADKRSAKNSVFYLNAPLMREGRYYVTVCEFSDPLSLGILDLLKSTSYVVDLETGEVLQSYSAEKPTAKNPSWTFFVNEAGTVFSLHENGTLLCEGADGARAEISLTSSTKALSSVYLFAEKDELFIASIRENFNILAKIPTREEEWRALAARP